MSGSPFAVRGVIEGFYGTPWTHSQRLDLIEFLHNTGMNTFVYSPKDDPLIRRDWRGLYSGDELARLGELVAACRNHEIRFIYCTSPGLSIRYSDPNDLAALVTKLASVAQLGVTDFGLFLDDIPMELQHAADRATYTDLVTAHAALVSSVYERLPRGSRLVVCPTVYCGYGDEDYIARLGRSIDPRIDIFWTGRMICSPTIDLADAATFARSAARPALIWDNYPVNDVAMTHELHVGPYRGRDRHLYRFVEGVISNGMELYESSKIAFATIADYLADPESYDAEASWPAAIRLVAGEADALAYGLFADNVRGSCLTESDAPLVSDALARFVFLIESGESAQAGRGLEEFAARLTAAADQLLAPTVGNPALIAEGLPWIEKFALGARVMSDLARLASDGVPLDLWVADLERHHASLLERRERVFGNALEMTLTDLIAFGGEASR